MKVLFIVFEFGEFISGGFGRVINGVTPALCRHLEVDVLHMFSTFFGVGRFNVYRCNEKEYGRKVYRNKLTAYWNIMRLIEKEGYDVIHFFYVYDSMADLMMEIKKRFPEKKIVYSVHNLVKYEKDVRENPDSYFSCEQKMFELADRVHVLNNACLSYFREAYPELADRKEVSVISNGLDEASFVPRDEEFYSKLRKRLRPGAKVVSTVTRWAHGKGLEFLLDAAAKIVSERDDVQFVLAGRKAKSWEKNGSRYVEMIDAKIKKLEPHVIVLGWINEAQRNSLFDLSDVYVMPSELEYFSYGSLEPLICGVPLLQSKIDCLQEMLSDGDDCLFYETRDSEDLYLKLTRMISDPAFAKRTAMNGSLKLKQEYRWPVIARKYFEMYKEVFAPAHILV